MGTSVSYSSVPQVLSRAKYTTVQSTGVDTISLISSHFMRHNIFRIGETVQVSRILDPPKTMRSSYVCIPSAFTLDAPYRQLPKAVS